MGILSFSMNWESSTQSMFQFHDDLGVLKTVGFTLSKLCSWNHTPEQSSGLLLNFPRAKIIGKKNVIIGGSHQVDKWKAKAEALDEAGISKPPVEGRPKPSDCTCVCVYLYIHKDIESDIYIYTFIIILIDIDR